jgi:hypothetical protein
VSLGTCCPPISAGIVAAIGVGPGTATVPLPPIDGPVTSPVGGFTPPIKSPKTAINKSKENPMYLFFGRFVLKIVFIINDLRFDDD